MSVVCFACNLRTVQQDSTRDHLAACRLRLQVSSLLLVLEMWTVDCGLCLGHTAEDMQHSINMSVCSNTSKDSTTQAKIGNVVQYA